MIKNDFYNKYKSYFDDFGERGFDLLWMTYYTNNSNSVKSTNPLHYITPALPPKEQIRDEVIHYIQHQDNIELSVQRSHLYIKTIILPLDYFRWIDPSDTRKIYWIKKNLYKIPHPPYILRHVTNENLYPELIHPYPIEKYITYPPQNNIVPLVGCFRFDNKYPRFTKKTGSFFDSLIFEIDKIFINFDEKYKYLEDLRLHWNNLQTPVELIKWIDSDNDAQISWAFDYMHKKGSVHNLFATPYDLPEDTDKYTTLMITLDNHEFSNNDQRTLFFEKMKKSWSQQKFRAEGKTKTNYHLPLTKNSKEKLEKLSNLMNMKENQVLEELINEKFQNIATDEKGKFKYC